MARKKRNTKRTSSRSSSGMSKGMKRIGLVILILLVLIPIAYGLYLYWQQRNIQQERTATTPPTEVTSPATDRETTDKSTADRKTGDSQTNGKGTTAQPFAPTANDKKAPDRPGTTGHRKPSKAEKTPQYVPDCRKLEHPQLRTQRKEQLIRHTGYVVSYNRDWKIPNWVAYELTRQETVGSHKRGDRFVADPQVKGPIATNADYARSGYDKGHMAPAADMKWSALAMKESFYFSNMCPQHPQLNRRGWKDLEEKIRDWAERDSVLIVICGPVLSKHPKTIGANQVVVPQRFFKVVLAPFTRPMRAIGFLFANQRAVEPLSTYAVSVDQVEELTQMDFFADLPDSIENRIEAESSYSQWRN